MNIIRFFSCFIIAAAQVSAFFCAQTARGQDAHKEGLRGNLAFENRNKLFLGECKKSSLDPELYNIADKFIYGDVFESGVLNRKQRELITIVALAVSQCYGQLQEHVSAALNIGVPAWEIREAVYTISPIIGFAKVFDAMDAVNIKFKERGIKLPLENLGTVSEGERFKKGREIQAPIYGDRTKNIAYGLPRNSDYIPRFLTEVCFGDFYTRQGIDIKTRELLIFCALVSLGGVEYSIGSHAMGNLKVGNSKEVLIAAIIQCVPYIGFPKALNALRITKDSEF